MPHPLDLPEDICIQQLDNLLTTKDKLNLRLVSRMFRDYYKFFLNPYKLPLYSFVREIFGANKEFFLIPENNKKDVNKHTEVVNQFSELFKDYLLSSLKNEQENIDFDIVKWLKEHTGFLKILNEILVLPKDFDYEATKRAVEGEREVYSDFHEQWLTENPATEIQKRNYLIQGFKEATEHQQKIGFSAKLFSEHLLIKDKSFFAKKITPHLLKTLEPKLKIRLKEAMQNNYDYDFIAIIQVFCIKELYKIDIKLPDKQLERVTKSLIAKIRDLKILPSHATIKIYDSSKNSSTQWAVAITLKQEDEAKSVEKAFASIGIKTAKGRIKASKEWSIQVKDYFPFELINVKPVHNVSPNQKMTLR